MVFYFFIKKDYYMNYNWMLIKNYFMKCRLFFREVSFVVGGELFKFINVI